MYNQIGGTFVLEPDLEITYDAAWELFKDDYEQRMTEQTKAHILLKQAKAIATLNDTKFDILLPTGYYRKHPIKHIL